MGKEAKGLLRVVTKCLAEHREFTTKVLTKVIGFSRVDGDAHGITRESTSDLRRSPRVPQAAPCYLITPTRRRTRAASGGGGMVVAAEER